MNWKYEAMNYNPQHKIVKQRKIWIAFWKVIIISNCFGFKSNVSLLFLFCFDIKFNFKHNTKKKINFRYSNWKDNNANNNTNKN